MAGAKGRIARESGTVEAMIRLYCRDVHGEGQPCQGCQGLLEYALKRLEACPFQEGKTTCARCPVHCYKPAMRQEIRVVMRHSGPRMLRRHPLMALLHLVDGLRRQPSPRRR